MSIISSGRDECKWYAVKVRPRNEFRVSAIFHDKLNLTSFVPCRKVWKRRKGVKTAQSRPILSTYVFIWANLSQINWKLFFLFGGVYGIVRNLGGPAVIPDDQVQALDKLCITDCPVYEIPFLSFKVNEKVVVVDGPLKGAVGYFVEISKKTGQFIVCLDMFKRAIVTELEADLVKPF